MQVVPTRQIGRDARTGRFIPIVEAQARPATAVVETIRIGFCRCAVRRLTDESRNSAGSDARARRHL